MNGLITFMLYMCSSMLIIEMLCVMLIICQLLKNNYIFQKPDIEAFFQNV